VVGSMAVGGVVAESPVVKVALWAGHSVIAALVLVVFVVVITSGGWSSWCVCCCCGFCVVTGVVGVGSGCLGLWVPLVKVALWAGHSVVAAVVLVRFVVVITSGGWSSSCVCYCCGFCVVTGVVGVGSVCQGLWV